MPYAVPAVVATLMWGYLYGADFGPIAQIARSVGLGTPDFLSAENILGSMMNIVTWEFVGYNMIIMYAALRSIPVGAVRGGRDRRRRSVPARLERQDPGDPAGDPADGDLLDHRHRSSSSPSRACSTLIAPNAITNSFTPNYYAYNLAFVNQELNYAAAIAFLLGLVIAVLSYIVQLGERTSRAA